MRFISENDLRRFIRRVVSEDAYSSGAFSSEQLHKSIANYTSGDLAGMGLSPSTAREVALDDLRVAFGEMGYDLYSNLQSAVLDSDRDEVEKIVREILDTVFVGPRGPLKDTGIENLDDILLPGDFDELVDLIVGDMFDGDEKITLY
jgi:hypothetical protein